VKAALCALARAGYKTELTFPHWLAKATYEGDILDLIFRAGNGLCEVDDSWFDRARDDELLGVPVKLCAPEEMIWMKAYIMERERFDGADIAHILLCCAAEIDWPHLVRRFGPDWRVLLSHLILFGYIYPGERMRIPDAIVEGLITRPRSEKRKLPGRNDHAAAYCFRGSNIWWTYRGEDFETHVWKSVFRWMKRTSRIGQMQLRKNERNAHKFAEDSGL